jgi:hypothetical protein
MRDNEGKTSTIPSRPIDPDSLEDAEIEKIVCERLDPLDEERKDAKPWDEVKARMHFSRELSGALRPCDSNF